MRYTIYKVTNLLNGKFYIGKHQTLDANDRYFGSGRALLNAIRTYGKENFVKEVLFDFDSEIEMNAKEKELVTTQLVADRMCYNLGVGGEGGPQFKGRSHSRESRVKISKANTGRKPTFSPSFYENKNRFPKGNRFWEKREVKPVSEETKQKIREARAKQTPPRLGHKQSQETKDKIRQTLLARYQSNKPV